MDILHQAASNLLTPPILFFVLGIVHQESDWPDSMEQIDEVFEGVPQDDAYQMLCGNVVDFFHLADYLPKWEALSQRFSRSA